MSCSIHPTVRWGHVSSSITLTSPTRSSPGGGARSVDRRWRAGRQSQVTFEPISHTPCLLQYAMAPGQSGACGGQLLQRSPHILWKHGPGASKADASDEVSEEEASDVAS